MSLTGGLRPIKGFYQGIRKFVKIQEKYADIGANDSMLPLANYLRGYTDQYWNLDYDSKHALKAKRDLDYAAYQLHKFLRTHRTYKDLFKVVTGFDVRKGSK